MSDGDFAIAVVSQADPIMPKIDLILGEDDLVWAEEPDPDSSDPAKRDPEYNELVQSIAIALLRQRGDFRYNRRRGMPWVQHDKMLPDTALLGTKLEGPNLRRIEVAAMSELTQAEDRVAFIEDVKAEVKDPNRRCISLLVRFRTITGQLAETRLNVLNIGGR